MDIKKDGGGLHIVPVEKGTLIARHPEYGRVIINIIRMPGAGNDPQKAKEAVIPDPDAPGTYHIVECAAGAYTGIRNPDDSGYFGITTFEEVVPYDPAPDAV